MYAYCDRNVFDIPRGERLLLWATRAWCCSVAHDDCPLRLLVPVFCRLGLITSTIHFHRALCCLQMGGADLKPFVCLDKESSSDCIGDAEAVHLALWAQVRDGNHKAAIRTLECLIDAEWVPRSLDNMAATCVELAERAELFATTGKGLRYWQ